MKVAQHFSAGFAFFNAPVPVGTIELLPAKESTDKLSFRSFLWDGHYCGTIPHPPRRTGLLSFCPFLLNHPGYGGQAETKSDTPRVHVAPNGSPRKGVSD
jgi:hypothetical protein